MHHSIGLMKKSGLMKFGLILSTNKRIEDQKPWTFMHPHRKGKRPKTQQFSPYQLCGEILHPGDHGTILKLPSWKIFSRHVRTIIICMDFSRSSNLESNTSQIQ